MKFAALFAAIYAAFFYLASVREVQRIQTLQAITRAPAFVPATVVEVEKLVGKHQSITYRVLFRYEVGGRRYDIHSGSIQSYLLPRFTEEPVEVAYDATNPAVAALRRDYDFRDKSETLAWTLFGRGIVAFVLAIPFSLLLAVPNGWVGRGAKERLRAAPPP